MSIKTTIQSKEEKKKEKSYYQFNMNDKVLVQLKPEGYSHWLMEYNVMLVSKRPTMEDLMSRADEDGFVKFQFWEFMQIFGSAIQLGVIPPFETNIRFKKSDMKDPSPGQ